MNAREERDKQRESESDRKRQNTDLHFDDRYSKKKTKLYARHTFKKRARTRFLPRLKKKDLKDYLTSAGGPLTKSAAEVGPVSKACDGNDHDGNDELGIKHPFSESTDLYDLPLEMVDVILKKSYLHWILNSSKEQRDEEVIRSLISVDVCFNRRITRQKFKNAIWRYWKDFYGKTMKRHSIIRNNRSYLENNIQPNDELIASLLSVNCITDEQSHFIQRHRSTRDKNYELLYVVESFDETQFSTFVNCLQRTNQRTVAKIIENGGGVIKIQVQTSDAKCAGSMDTKINDLRDRTKPRSHETDKLIAQLREEGIEILSSQLNGQTVVVWIWCRSQTAIANLQKLYKSNQLRDKYFENIQPSVSKDINIDSNQFKKTVVVRGITVNFTQKIDLQSRGAGGITKLRNEIYVLCHRDHLIRVYEDRYPFRLKKDMEIEETKLPVYIGSSEKENCLYVYDYTENCVWKITRQTDDQHKILKWLTAGYAEWTLSVPRDGELLMINRSSHNLMIYGSDAELIRSIPLTKVINDPWHAVETSIGNFIIIHRHLEMQGEEDEKKDEDKDEDGGEDAVVMKEMKNTKWLKSKEGKGESNRRRLEMTSMISELTRDGQMVIRRFIPSDETQQLNECKCLLIDSDDRVFVADEGNHRVILLDSDLKWNQILCLTRKHEEEQNILWPYSLFYDEEMKRLIVRAYCKGHIKVYTLSRN